MKKQIIKAFALLVLGGSISGCGNDFLDTDYYKGIDVETGLNSVNNISTALNGVYDRLFRYYFAGNYAINIGDVPTDISYWNVKTNHWNNLYTYTVMETDGYLKNIWNYGYKVADNAARVIEASEALYNESSTSEKAELDQIMAEAYALRGYAQLILTNVFCHQIKVAGTDYSSQPGIVVIDKPIKALTEVSRSTVGQSYQAVLSDLNNALTHFNAAGGDRGELVYFTTAAVHGLLARTFLYMENWDSAIQSAKSALTTKGITTLTYGDAAYKALYNTGTSNTESMFALAITPTQAWSANSSGTLWSTYNFSPSPKLLSLYADKDCRTSVFGWAESSTETVPVFNAGKFAHFSSGNPAYGTHYIVNAPEMFLIIAEANVKSSSGSLSNAQEALLTVAKRNADITSVSDLPSTADGLMEFLQNERARELFQEGMRLWDLRRWDVLTGVQAYAAPDIEFKFNNYKISNLVLPIPVDEVNSGFGVEQNDWFNTLPK